MGTRGPWHASFRKIAVRIDRVPPLPVYNDAHCADLFFMRHTDSGADAEGRKKGEMSDGARDTDGQRVNVSRRYGRSGERAT